MRYRVSLLDADRCLVDATATAATEAAGVQGEPAAAEGDGGDPFFDPMNRRWRLSTGDASLSAAAVKPNQRLQYLCLQEVNK